MTKARKKKKEKTYSHDVWVKEKKAQKDRERHTARRWNFCACGLFAGDRGLPVSDEPR